jgi:GTP cyclohydrolase II
MSSWISSILSIIASWLGLKKIQAETNNSKDIVKNEKAKIEVKNQDEIEEKVSKASQGDEKALDDLRKLSGQ